MTCKTNNLLRDNLPHHVLKLQLVKLCCDYLRSYWYLPALCKTFNTSLIWIPYEDNVIFILYGMIWARTKEWIFEDPTAFLLHEDNISAAHIQQYLYTYYRDVIFLTWISKHKKGDLDAAYDSFLFMGVCHTTMEDLFMRSEERR